MHGSSLCVCASVYRCICMDQVYMYVRVFIGVYAWIKFICVRVFIGLHGSSLYVCASVYRCICMDQVYMYVRVFIGVYAWIKFICMCECL